MVTLDIWNILQKANEICGILSLIVSVIALFKVSDIQKQIRVRVDSKVNLDSARHSKQSVHNLKQTAKGEHNFQAGNMGDYNGNK